MSLFNAHIFKRRSRGDREEVRIKLFNLDGTDADLGGGEAKSIFFAGTFNVEPIPDNSGLGHELPLGNFGSPRVEGDFVLADGHLTIPEAVGYALRLRGVWSNVGAPSSGHLTIRVVLVYGESNNEEVQIEVTSSAPDLVLNFDETVLALPSSDGYLKIFVDQNTTSDPDATPSVQAWLSVVKL